MGEHTRVRLNTGTESASRSRHRWLRAAFAGALAAALAVSAACSSGGTEAKSSTSASSSETPAQTPSESSAPAAGEEATDEEKDAAANKDDEPAVKGELLTLSNIVPAATQRAADARWGNESVYMQAVYDTLLHETTSGAILPWLARDWMYSEGNTVLTLTLRTDVTFTDGTPFDAEVAVANLQRFQQGASPNKGRLSKMESAEATAPDTVKITLSQPDPGFLLSLAQNPGLQASPASFDAEDSETNPIGSGPYMLDTVATVPGSTYVYTANPGYWASDYQHYNNLVINVYDQDPTIVNAVSSGEVNGAQLPGSSAIDQIEAAGFTLYPQEIAFNGLLILDRDGVTNPALGDVRVRQAINYAIDKDVMLEAAANGLGTVTTQVFGPSSPAYDPALDDRYPYDPEMAKRLLAEAGYPDGFELTMPAIAGTGDMPLASLPKQFLEDIGITVVYDQQADLASYVGALMQGGFGIGWMQLQPSPVVAFVVSDRIAAGGGFNPFSPERAEVTDWLNAIYGGTPEESEAAAKALNQYVVEEAWFDPWYRNKTFFAADGNTEVTQQDTNTYPYLWNIKPKA